MQNNHLSQEAQQHSEQGISLLSIAKVNLDSNFLDRFLNTTVNGLRLKSYGSFKQLLPKVA